MTRLHDPERMRRTLNYRAWAKKLGQAVRRLDRAIMPIACAFCGVRLLPAERRVCKACYIDLPWIGNACCRCAEPLDACIPSGVCCGRCQARPPPVAVTIAPLHYEFPVDAALKALKFGRRLHYAAAFAELLAAQGRRLPSTVDALLPVPLHWRRQALRGFNQSRELCLPLARRLGLPITDVARRRRHTRYQSGLSAAERHRNLRNAFSIRRATRHRHIVIVDDVVTTGETTRQLAIALIDGGVPQVSVLAVARARRRNIRARG